MNYEITYQKSQPTIKQLVFMQNLQSLIKDHLHSIYDEAYFITSKLFISLPFNTLTTTICHDTFKPYINYLNNPIVTALRAEDYKRCARCFIFILKKIELKPFNPAYKLSLVIANDQQEIKFII